MQGSKNLKTRTASNYFLEKSFNPKTIQVKSSKDLNISLGANESHTQFKKFEPRQFSKHEFSKEGKTKDQSQRDEISRRLNSISKENQNLRSQNEWLRVELSRISSERAEFSKDKVRFYSREHSRERTGDLRGTIKRDMGEYHQLEDVKDLKMKLEIVSKQCKMYEQVIDKMETTIRKLTDDNRLASSNTTTGARIDFKGDSGGFVKLQEFNSLKEKVNLIMNEYTNLESKMHSNELEWVIWKEQWVTQKNIYLNKIKQLEAKIKAGNKFG